ncbi:MAG TPA: putative urea ABC transporter substrate-binding protein [Porticoccaceae bacterium]
MKKPISHTLAVLALIGGLAGAAQPALARSDFRICWSIYVGWMPWQYGDTSGIVRKWGEKYGIDIEVVQINDYIESINQYTAGAFDGCTMTNMDALTIPAAGGVDSTVLIVGDYSNGNDVVILKDKKTLEEIRGQRVNLVELSVSHYLLARALESVGMSERDITVVNTGDADMVGAYLTPGVTAVTTWNPLVSEILAMPNSYNVFDSSKIPGEIIDSLVVNTETLKQYPELGKALTGAWYEIMAGVRDDGDVRALLGEASGTDQAGYEAQLAATEMFYDPADAVAFVTDPQLKKTMQYVAEFSFEHGLLGEGAPSAEFIGVETPAGIFGNAANVKLRFDPDYMQMAADGEL